MDHPEVQNSKTLLLKATFENFLINFKNYQTKREFPQITEEEIDIIKNFFSSVGVKLELLDSEKKIDYTEWWYVMKPITKEDTSFFLPLIALEFSLYSKSVFAKVGLKKIILCHSLQYCEKSYNQDREAIPDFSDFSMVYCTRGRMVDYMRRVIHHEFFHYIDNVIHGTYYYENPEWIKFNPKNFTYGSGGSNNRVEYDLDPKLKSFFFTYYSTTAVEEDKAETFAWLVNNGENLISIQQYPTLAAKCTFIKNLLENFDGDSFSQGKDDFWSRAIRYKLTIINEYLK